MGWVGLSVKARPVPTHCYGQGHLSLALVAEGLIPPGFKPLWAWSLPRLSGQAVAVPHHSHGWFLPKSCSSFPISPCASSSGVPIFRVAVPTLGSPISPWPVVS